jgi:Domain of unknown function (DUF397)
MPEPISENAARVAQHRGLSWRKSSFSFANGDCVEVANLPGGGVGVRDSKDTAGPVLRFTASEWEAFVAGARNGEFDQLTAR